jgi:hypothetical protein
MIKYHGTPVGGTKSDAIKFLDGRHALISFAHQGQVAEVLECCESFCLDNGAFTIWKTTGGDIDLVAYRGWVESLRRHSSFDFYLIPDKIMGSELENDNLIKEWDELGCGGQGVPVYHLGENPDRFLRLAEEYDKVAFGSTDLWGKNGSKVWWKYMSEFMEEVTDENGYLPCKVHGLRMLDINLFTLLPLHSGDSTNAGVNGHIAMKKGTLPAITRWQGNERIAQRIESFQSAPFWDIEKLFKENKLK